MKLGDIIKVKVSNISISITEDGPKSVSERELAGPQCIGGYTVHKLHNNFRNHKNWRDMGLQQATSLTGATSLTSQLSPVKIKKL